MDAFLKSCIVRNMFMLSMYEYLSGKQIYACPQRLIEADSLQKALWDTVLPHEFMDKLVDNWHS